MHMNLKPNKRKIISFNTTTMASLGFIIVVTTFRVSIYSVLLVILQSYSQNVSLSMFYCPVMGVIEVKIIFNREDSVSLVGKNKGKGFKQCFSF